MSTLDFLVWGVPRSGTTALRQAINLHPNLFCAHEWQLGLRKWSELNVPRTIMLGDHPNGQAVTRDRDRAELGAKLETGGVRRYGDKTPTYYVQLHDFPSRLQHLAIYRSPAGFIPSWDRRAADVSDQWHAGQDGLLALVEWMLFLDAIAEAPRNVVVVSHGALFRHNSGLYQLALQTLLGETAPAEAVRAFETTMFAKRGPDRTARLPHPYRRILREIDADELTNTIDQVQLVAGEEIAPILRSYVDANAVRLAELVREYLTKPKRAEHRNFTRTWLTGRHARFVARDGWSPTVGSALELLLGSLPAANRGVPRLDICAGADSGA
jgi:hypothetical protein